VGARVLFGVVRGPGRHCRVPGYCNPAQSSIQMRAIVENVPNPEFSHHRVAKLRLQRSAALMWSWRRDEVAAAIFDNS